MDASPARAARAHLVELQLADWRRRIHELYAAVRERPGREGWELWCAERERLFLQHPQSPLPPADRVPSSVPVYFAYEPSWRRTARVTAATPEHVILPGSATAAVEAVRFATAEVDGLPPLSVFWLTDYAGGIFLSYRDAGSGSTYGGGRYLLDTAKGADMGQEGDGMVLDFNFSYQPSCSYDPRWNCPLPPRDNWLTIEVPAGERLR